MTRVPRRSVAALAVDERLLDAGLEEIAAVGIDRLGMSPAARRAGLTTGALYARYENATELAVAVWERRVRDDLRRLLQWVLDVVTREDADRAALAGCLATPPPAVRAAVEFLVAARRMDELAEVVGPDLRSWFAEWAGDVDEGVAWVVGPAAMLIGSLLYTPNTYDAALWIRQLEHLHAADRAWRPREPRPAPAPAVPAVAHTGDDGRDALIAAAMSVVARSGVERATVSRIARRAGFTSGGLFARYPTKLALLLDAMESIQLAILVNDVRLLHDAPVGRLGSTVAQSILDAMFATARDVWRPFRIEVYLAARHQPALAESLLHDHMASVMHERGQAWDALPQQERHVTSRAADFFPLGLFVLDQLVPDIARVDLRPVFHAWDRSAPR